jgi:hypothetical protein
VIFSFAFCFIVVVFKQKEMAMLFAIHGKMGAGKDTIYSVLKEFFPNLEQKAFATPIKQMVAIMTNTTYEMQLTTKGKNTWIPHCKQTCGQLQQLLGELMRTHVDEDVWVSSGLEQYMDQRDCTMDLCLPPAVEEESKTQSVGAGDVAASGGPVVAVSSTKKGAPQWAFTDLRFKNEHKGVKRAGAFKIKTIGDPLGIRAKSTRNIHHISETDLDDCDDWDLIIDNRMYDPSLELIRTQIAAWIARQPCFQTGR